MRERDKEFEFQGEGFCLFQSTLSKTIIYLMQSKQREKKKRIKTENM